MKINREAQMNHIPKCEVHKFVTLIESLSKKVGSRRTALEITGTNPSTFVKMVELSELTEKQAKKIIGGYKKWKAENAVAT